MLENALLRVKFELNDTHAMKGDILLISSNPVLSCPYTILLINIQVSIKLCKPQQFNFYV